MAADSLFQITVYDRTMRKMGTVAAPTALVITPRHLQQPTGAITVPVGNPRAADLMTPGARAVITYQGTHILGGILDSHQLTGPDVGGTVTLQVRDDYCLLSEILAWTVPTNPIGSQTADYRTLSGPAETVLKTVVQENVTRLGWPVTVAPDQGRGATIKVQFRFQAIEDQITPWLDSAGIGVTVQQVGARFVLDCYEPRVYPRDLTVASRVVQSYALTRNRFTASQVIVGGQGDLAARVLRRVTDPAREALWGPRGIEIFQDATDLTTATDLDSRGRQTLAEEAAKAGLSVQLSETATFRYDPSGGTGVRVGDVVTIVPGPPIPSVTDVLREATLSWTAANGLTVTPVVGDADLSVVDQIIKPLAAVAKAIRNQIAGR